MVNVTGRQKKPAGKPHGAVLGTERGRKQAFSSAIARTTRVETGRKPDHCSDLFLERSAITCGPAGAIFVCQATDIPSSSPLFEPAQPVQIRAATTQAETQNSLLRKARLPHNENTLELPVVFQST